MKLPLGVAWTTLGFDAQQIMEELARTPRSKRVEAARAKLEEARKTAKQLLFAHHPDRGGDPQKFKRVGDALKAVEEHTEEFARKMAEASNQEQERKHPFIKLKD